MSLSEEWWKKLHDVVRDLLVRVMARLKFHVVGTISYNLPSSNLLECGWYVCSVPWGHAFSELADKGEWCSLKCLLCEHRFKKFSNKSGYSYMISVCIIFSGVLSKLFSTLRGFRRLQTSPLVLLFTGTGCAQPRGSERVKTPHHMDFYT